MRQVRVGSLSLEPAARFRQIGKEGLGRFVGARVANGSARDVDDPERGPCDHVGASLGVKVGQSDLTEVDRAFPAQAEDVRERAGAAELLVANETKSVSRAPVEPLETLCGGRRDAGREVARP